ncbi:DUF6862 domain-containing protein, partial [Billgrantia sp. Q4P2]|uniref:DUF6862 domain-containing protein n=1 Tax=Billgrantia sp. Q4P2 TaxID=3463857 RepID=UPI004056546E
QTLEEERLAIQTLSQSRDLALEEACGQGGSAQACSYERALLQVAMNSWQDVTLGREDRDTVFAEYLHTASQYGQHQQQRMERIGAEALSEMVVDSINAPIIMGQLVGQALLGDEESQALLREMGQEIKAFADNLPHSIPESISGSIREQLAQADALELAGQQDEADRLRVRVALENQSMLMGTGVLAASLPRLARNVVTSRSGIAGAGDFSGSRAQDGVGVPNNNLEYWASSSNAVPLSYDISLWGEYGLPSDGYFSRTITLRDALKMQDNLPISFGGRSVDGFPDGAGFLGSAEELYRFTNARDLQKALDIRYEPDFILEFQLKDTSRLQNLLQFDDPLFRAGGKTLSGQREFNFPGITSDDIVNWRLRALKEFD